MLSDDQNNSLERYRPLAELLPATWQHASYRTSDQQQLTYWKADGAGQAVLLLHGFQASGLMWLRVAEALRADHTLIMPDLRGHGGSSAVVEGFTPHRLAQDLTELLEHLALPAAIVVGFSIGADVAATLALTHPERVQALVLAEPPYRVFPQMPPAAPQPPFVQRILDTLGAMPSQTHSHRLRAAHSLLPPGVALWDEIDLVPMAEAMMQFNTALFSQRLSDELIAVQPATIAAYTMPTLLLTGDQPASDPARDAAIAATHQSGSAQHQVIAGAGHFLHAQQPQAMIAVLRTFFSAVTDA